MSRRVWSLLLTALVWAAVAASAVYWGLRVFTTATPLPRETQLAGAGVRAGGDLTRLLGEPAVAAPVAAEPEVASDARFQLVGVVAPKPQPGGRTAAEGVALIAVDGKPARAYRVGAAVDASLVLQAVHQRGATLGPRGAAATVSLSLAAPAPAATGTLPPAFGPSATAVPAPSFTPNYAPSAAPPPPSQSLAPGRRGSQLPYVMMPPPQAVPQPAEGEQSPTSVPDPSQTR